MNIKAVFCDIDGTLLNRQKEITASTKLFKIFKVKILNLYLFQLDAHPKSIQ